jgi:tetratricopeptide (TPR) repeat protein
MRSSRLFALVLASVALAQPARSQGNLPHSATHQSASSDSVPVYGDLGSYSRRISTRSAEAQRYFDQGLRLTYGFGHPEARRAFRAAIRADSGCAMCHWGLAWALGPYINGPNMDSSTAVQAHAAAQQALVLASTATPVEQALVEAMGARYASVPTRANRRKLDSAYVSAMRDVVRRFPRDLDAASLLGEALMVLRPWDQWTRVGDPQPGTEEVLRVLESVLRRDIRHPGACHHYIHATEASRQPERAAACADLLGRIIPGASHIPHMPSHTYMRIGRYGDAVRANQQARLADQRAEHGSAPGIYVAHNTHMLAGSASMDGQSAIALQAAADLTRESPAAAYYHRAVLARFGRWKELLDLPSPTTPLVNVGMNAFGRGMAHLGLARADSASSYLRTLDGVIAGTADSLRFRGHAQKALLGIARGILAGEIESRAKRYDAAIAALRAAVPLEDSLRYDEPEPWPIPVRHVLGAVLLEADKPADAEATYREDLRVHPGNGWALAGLERALRAQDKLVEADGVAREKERVWTRADVILLGSRIKP